VHYGYICLKFAENWEEKYQISEQPQKTETAEELRKQIHLV